MDYGHLLNVELHLKSGYNRKSHKAAAIDWTLLDFFHILLLVVESRDISSHDSSRE